MRLWRAEMIHFVIKRTSDFRTFSDASFRAKHAFRRKELVLYQLAYCAGHSTPLAISYRESQKERAF
jgi:hypothetical protein